MTALAAERRALPPGPAIAADYRFLDAAGNSLSLSDLFEGIRRTQVRIGLYGCREPVRDLSRRMR